MKLLAFFAFLVVVALAEGANLDAVDRLNNKADLLRKKSDRLKEEGKAEAAQKLSDLADFLENKGQRLGAQPDIEISAHAWGGLDARIARLQVVKNTLTLKRDQLQARGLQAAANRVDARIQEIDAVIQRLQNVNRPTRQTVTDEEDTAGLEISEMAWGIDFRIAKLEAVKAKLQAKRDRLADAGITEGAAELDIRIAELDREIQRLKSLSRPARSAEKSEESKESKEESKESEESKEKSKASKESDEKKNSFKQRLTNKKRYSYYTYPSQYGGSYGGGGQDYGGGYDYNGGYNYNGDDYNGGYDYGTAKDYNDGIGYGLGGGYNEDGGYDYGNQNYNDYGQSSQGSYPSYYYYKYRSA